MKEIYISNKVSKNVIAISIFKQIFRFVSVCDELQKNVGTHAKKKICTAVEAYSFMLLRLGYANR